MRKERFGGENAFVARAKICAFRKTDPGNEFEIDEEYLSSGGRVKKYVPADEQGDVQSATLPEYTEDTAEVLPNPIAMSIPDQPGTDTPADNFAQRFGAS